jgi:hypothetical protein
MSETITCGSLSRLESQDEVLVVVDVASYETVIGNIAPQLEIVEFHPERETILIKSKISQNIESEVIRSILQELQVRTQRSFVALINPINQHVLITVRG